MPSKTIKIIKWAIMNFSLLGLFIYGNLYNVDWMLNISVPLLWFVALVGILVGSLHKELAQNLIKEDPNYTFSIPRYLDIFYDAIFSIVILGMGYTALGIFYIIHIFMLDIFRKKVEKLKAEK